MGRTLTPSSQNPTNLGDLGRASEYEVILEFTDPLEPQLVSERKLPFVSLRTEIVANTPAQDAASVIAEHGRIPYAAPLYIWEVKTGDATEVVYIGKTVDQRVQDRFERHASLVRLLSEYVNDSSSLVFVRLCSRFDVCYENRRARVRRAIEHFHPSQASKIVTDVEAFLIFQYKPRYNKAYKNRERKYWKPFSVSSMTNAP